MQSFNPDASWRDSARSTRLWIFNSSTTFPLLFLLFNIQLWTFIFTIAVMLFFLLLEYYQFTPTVFYRFLRNWFAGNVRLSRPWWTR